MRRLLSILLLATLGLPAAAPALALTVSANPHLPACCRRNGAHHCTGNMAHPTNTPTLSSVCPNYPQPTATTAATPFTALTPAVTGTTPHLLTLTTPQQAETSRRVSRERSRHKRGPPAQLL